MTDVLFVDQETGESLGRPVSQSDCILLAMDFEALHRTNLETGEPEVTTENHSSRRRVPFQIPRALQRQDDDDDDEDHLNVTINLEKSCVHMLKMKKCGETEPFAKTNPILLLVPIVFYFRWVIAILMCFEAFFHIWAHHKNKHLKNADVYFRSPFHSITSEFCAMCQSEKCMNRIGKIQEIRAGKFLRQCNYMKRVVT